MSNAIAAQVLVLNDRREEILFRLKKAQAADNSYAHNDMLLANLERELNNIDEDLQAIFDDSADFRLFGDAE